jgi:hypothetical protein
MFVHAFESHDLANKHSRDDGSALKDTQALYCLYITSIRCVSLHAALVNVVTKNARAYYCMLLYSLQLHYNYCCPSLTGDTTL